MHLDAEKHLEIFHTFRQVFDIDKPVKQDDTHHAEKRHPHLEYRLKV